MSKPRHLGYQRIFGRKNDAETTGRHLLNRCGVKSKVLVIGGLTLPFVAMAYFATRTEKPEPCRDEHLLRGDKCHPDAEVKRIADEFVCVCRRPASAPTKSEDGGVQ